MSELSSSRFGKLLGFLTMPLIKGALIPFDDADFPVDIQVYSKPDCAHIFKQRIYRLHDRPPIQFTSYMRESEKGEVLEYVGMGLGMRLVLRVEGGDLYFTSDGYFWDVFGVRIPIPGLFTPGKTFLCHRNDNAAQFNIQIEIRHALFGTTFRQVGVFWEAPSPEVLLKDPVVPALRRAQDEPGRCPGRYPIFVTGCVAMKIGPSHYIGLAFSRRSACAANSPPHPRNKSGETRKAVNSGAPRVKPQQGRGAPGEIAV